MSLSEAGEIVGGQLAGSDVVFDAVSIDTRTLQPGDLFIAITGENFDGNDFVEEAARKQACGAIVARHVQTSLPTVRVTDCTKALGELGAYNRGRSQARMIALTGSQGKTTVKALTAGILSHHGPVLETRGNLNNEYGVPLTLLGLEKQHEFAVIELGANAPGEIDYMAELVQPDIAHITNAASTHLKGFGSLEGVAEAKGEIWEHLGHSGTAVINLDDAFADRWRERAGDSRIVGVSAEGDEGADYRADDVDIIPPACCRFTLHAPAGRTSVRLALLGRHNVANALAAAALALEAGCTLEDVRRGLEEARPVTGRMCPREGLNGAAIIDDSYNASPASFRAAIDVLAMYRDERILVMGDMAELGKEEVGAHEALGRYARERGVDRLYAAGPLSAAAAAGFGEGARHASCLDELADMIRPVLSEHVTVLVKGSRSSGMEKLVQRLIRIGD